MALAIVLAPTVLPFAVHTMHAVSSQSVAGWRSASARLAAARAKRRSSSVLETPFLVQMTYEFRPAPFSCGQVLVARPGAERVLGEELREGVAILVASQGWEGSTALVINRPTPLLLRHLDLPRYHAFGQCRLFHGGTIDTCSSELATDLLSDPSAPRRRQDVTSGHNLLRNIHTTSSSDKEAHNLSPQHWIHRVEGIKGSTELVHGLFLGGSLDHASLSIAVNQAQAEDFKFFHRQIEFEAGEFERLFCEGASTPLPPTRLCMLVFGQVLCKRALGVWQGCQQRRVEGEGSPE